jgi:hypothetical protein
MMKTYTANLLLASLLAAVAGLTGCNKRENAEITKPQNPLKQTEYGAYLKNMSQELENGNVELAHDYLLAAMRVSPEREEVFLSAIDFIKRTLSNDKYTEYTMDIAERTDNVLIHFLPNDLIKNARQQCNDVVKEIDDRRNKKQKQLETDIAQWSGKVNNAVSKDTNEEESRELREQGDAFIRQIQDPNSLEQVSKQLNRLVQHREWLYNLQVNQIIDEASNKNNKTKESLKPALLRLAKIDEFRLSPYLLDKYTKTWKELFDKLTSDEDKLEVTKTRMIKELEL